MNTWTSGRSVCHPCHSSLSLNETAATFAAYDQCNYLSHLNYKLVNQINEVQTEKYFYRNKLNYQLRNHTSQLEEAHRLINQKNAIIMEMQEEIDRLKKQFRTVEDECLHIKNQSLADKEHFKKEMDNMERKCKQKVQKTQESLEKQYELKINRRVDEVTRECEDRIKMYNHQIKQLSENSTQLAHQLKLMQDQHRDVLLKNDLLIQQSINRELRKRDYQAQNNYLRDVSQYQALLKDKRQIKEEMQNLQSKLKLANKKNSQLQALLQSERTKYSNLLEAFENQRGEKRKLQGMNYNLSSNYADKAQADTNTEQPFVPVVMPVDLDLISEIVGLKQFVVEKIVQNFLQFFNKTAVTDPKKKSLSLTTFKNSLETLKQTNPQNKILLYIQANLDRIIRIYCPAMTYSKQYMTLKDQFIKRTLMQCETIANPTQKLYRILQLISRLKNPVTHLKSEVSAGQLRLVEIKFLAALKKALGQ